MGQLGSATQPWWGKMRDPGWIKTTPAGLNNGVLNHMKTQVNVEEVRAMNQRRAEINALEFTDIEWMLDGKPIEIDPSVAEGWDFTGMGNYSFVEYLIDSDPEHPRIVTMTMWK